tara:strand:+ start:1399 stop:1959 length:561 start_codon:yes stop_codon:yes gene_type:complete
MGKKRDNIMERFTKMEDKITFLEESQDIAVQAVIDEMNATIDDRLAQALASIQEQIDKRVEELTKQKIALLNTRIIRLTEIVEDLSPLVSKQIKKSLETLEVTEVQRSPRRKQWMKVRQDAVLEVLRSSSGPLKRAKIHNRLPGALREKITLTNLTQILRELRDKNLVISLGSKQGTMWMVVSDVQ